MQKDSEAQSFLDESSDTSETEEVKLTDRSFSSGDLESERLDEKLDPIIPDQMTEDLQHKW